MAETWAADGVDLPDEFTFPITILGQVADLHGAGVYVNTTPTRVDCDVHVETKPAPSQDLPRLEIFPSPLHPERGTELGVGYEFQQQLSLALWLYRSAPCRITPWPSRRTIPVSWSLRGGTLEGFRRFSKALIGFQDDRQAYLVARVSPDVLEDDDLRVFFVGGHQIDGDWLKARWPVMAATDLYERSRRSREADIAFLLLMMALEVLFNDGSSDISRKIAQRCALLNGRDSARRKQLFDMLLRLYDRRSRLVHGNLLEKRRVFAIRKEDLFHATDVVRLSLLRFIAFRRAKTKTELMTSLDHAMFDSSVSEQLETEVEEHWRELGADLQSAIDVGAGPEDAP
ncbi:MAG: hypothetical protein ACREF4_03970 [Gammaproteobacteria bacterium]